MRFLLRMVLLASVLVVCLWIVLMGVAALVGAVFRAGASLLRVPYRILTEWRFPGLHFPIGFFELLVGVLLLSVLVCVALAAWKVLKGRTSKGYERVESDQSRIMQQLYRGLSRLEERVESLETILLDRAGRTAARRTTGED